MGIGSVAVSNLGPMRGQYVSFTRKSVFFMLCQLSILFFFVNLLNQPKFIKIIMLNG